ncbi:hypothetical protein M405DRAFT_426834 [Rhizopogon salebrosus TDB-379]|nr:hypothetical protein M405DRAFT_426834 [Rhizopogon salebrosus TDB-379]
MDLIKLKKITTPWQEYQYTLATVTSHECILCSTAQWLLVCILTLLWGLIYVKFRSHLFCPS